MEFKNKQVFDQLDWDTEIANEPKLDTDEAQGRRTSNATMCWSYVDQITKQQIPLINTDHGRANLMRMVQYFFAKFIYHHDLFYEKYNAEDSKDLAKLKEEFQRGEYPLDVYKKALGAKLAKSDLPLNHLQRMEKIFIKKINKDLKEKSPKDGGYKEAKAMFEKEGLKIVKPKGLRKEGDRDTVCTIHDGIRYHLYLLKSSNHSGMRTQEKAHEEANDYKSLIEKYHPIVKRIHKEFKKMDGMKNLWVMEGGGAQHQAFFGNEDGYIATLYLGLKNSKNVRVDFTLVFDMYEDDEQWHKYKDFKMEGIECQAFGKVNPFKKRKHEKV